jgi:hypothetical protein
MITTARIAAATTMVGTVTAATATSSKVAGKRISPAKKRRRYVGTSFTIRSPDLFQFNNLHSEKSSKSLLTANA